MSADNYETTTPNASPDDLEEVRKTLRSVLGHLHPDTSGENFHPEQFQRVKSAISLIENQRTRSVNDSSTTDIAALVNSLRVLDESLSREDLSRSLEERTTVFLRELGDSIKEFNRRTLPYKISSASVTALLTSLWFFPNAIDKNPILSIYWRVGSPAFAVTWFVVLICSGIVWALVKIREMANDEIVSQIKSESYQNHSFDLFIRVRRNSTTTGGGCSFTKQEFVDQLSWDLNRDFSRQYNLKVRVSLMKVRVGERILDELAEVILKRAEQNGAIERVKARSISDTYTILDCPASDMPSQEVDYENLPF